MMLAGNPFAFRARASQLLGPPERPLALELAPVRHAPAGAYPDTSDATSGKAGAFWFTAPTSADSSESRVYLTQYDAMLRRVQEKARRLLPGTIKYSDENGCAGLTDANNANVIQRDAIGVDGVWGRQTSRVLQWILCATGNPRRAERVAVDRQLNRMNRETLAELAWVATQLDTVGTPESPNPNTAAPSGISIAGITVPSDTTVPTWTQRVRSAQADQDWIGSYVPTSGAAPPRAPSEGGTPTPTPEPEPHDEGDGGAETTTEDGGESGVTTTRKPTAAAPGTILSGVPDWMLGVGALVLTVGVVAAVSSGGKKKASKERSAKRKAAPQKTKKKGPGALPRGTTRTTVTTTRRAQ